MAPNNFLAAEGDSVRSRLSATAAVRPLVAALATYFLRRSSEPMATPKTLAV